MRGQAAIEYILVSSAALLIILPAIFLFFQYGQSQTQSFETSQVLRIGNRLSIEAQTVYNGGLGTRTTLTEQFPTGIDNITFMNDTANPGGEFFIYYDPTNSGIPQIYGFPVSVPAYINVSSTNWGEGQRRIRLDVLENLSAGPDERYYVNITVI